MLSRCHHLETATAVAAGLADRRSAAMASLEDPQSSMTFLNEAIFDMRTLLGQFVPKHKANLSADPRNLSGHTVPMADKDEEQVESQWREEFRQRIIAARGGRTQAVMAELLGILTNTYGKYEAPGRKSVMPVRLLPRFAKICGISLEELIEGPKDSAARSASKPAHKIAPKAPRRKTG